MTRNNKNWNFPHCLDCGKRLGSYLSKRCIKCSNLKTNTAMKGRKLTEEHKRKISEGNKIAYKKGIRVAVWEGKHMPEYIKIKIGKANSGENSCNWKGGITSKDKIQRSKFRNTMQKQIFERDNYTCQLCGIRGGFLQVDHIQSWKDCIEGRFDLENCRTLCQKCHYKLTFKREMPKDVKTWGQNFKQIERMVD